MTPNQEDILKKMGETLITIRAGKTTPREIYGEISLWREQLGQIFSTDD